MADEVTNSSAKCADKRCSFATKCNRTRRTLRGAVLPAERVRAGLGVWESEMHESAP